MSTLPESELAEAGAAPPEIATLGFSFGTGILETPLAQPRNNPRTIAPQSERQ